MNSDKIPCIECIAFAACKQKKYIECSILDDWDVMVQTKRVEIRKLFPNAKSYKWRGRNGKKYSQTCIH